MSITVGQAMQFGGLAQGRLLSGGRSLGNIIDRVSILEAPCSPDWDYQNCLFITAFYAHKENLAGQLETIEILAQHNCAVLVFQRGILDRLPEQVIQRAEELGLPVVEIPEAITYPEVITPLVGAILEEKTYLLQRSEEIHRRLTDISLCGGGLPAIASELSDLLSLPVAVTDAWGSLVAASEPQVFGAAVLAWLKKVLCGPMLPDSPLTYYPEQGLWAMQFFSGQMRQSDGYILASDPAREIDPLGLLAIEQASIIAALEMVKQRAVLETERRLQRDFFENLLSDGFSSVDEITSRAHTLGWEFTDKRVVALLAMDEVFELPNLPADRPEARPTQGSEGFGAYLSEVVKEVDPLAIVVEQNERILLLFHCEIEPAAAQLRHTLQVSAEAVLSRLKIQGFRAAIGFGGFYPTVPDLKQSYDEAQMALKVSKNLAHPQPITWYDDVALYVLLERIARQPETGRWFERTLGRLVEYDRSNHADLVRTLESYFDSNQVLQQAAFNLFVHPKTLRYRLHRIQEILGTDPFSKDQQLNFYLATKLARLFDFSAQG